MPSPVSSSLHDSFDGSFFDSPATVVAPLLLGAIIHSRDVSIRITEVEAYLGDTDPGSHAYRGEGKRNAAMFGPSGRLYVYLSYGMHLCTNIVCSPNGVPSAVLLRAGEVVAGRDVARTRRPRSRSDADLGRGPGRFSAALGIVLADGGKSVVADDIRLTPGERHSLATSTPRTGVSGEGGSERFPWRHFLVGETSVSPYREHRPRASRG